MLVSDPPPPAAAALPVDPDWWLLRCPHCQGVLRVERDGLLSEPGFVCGHCVKLIRTPPRPEEMLEHIEGSERHSRRRRRQRQQEGESPPPRSAAGPTAEVATGSVAAAGPASTAGDAVGSGRRQRAHRLGPTPPLPSSGPDRRSVAARAAKALAQEEEAAGEGGGAGDDEGAAVGTPLPWFRLAAGFAALLVALVCVLLVSRGRPQPGAAPAIDRSQVQRYETLAQPERDLHFATTPVVTREPASPAPPPADRHPVGDPAAAGGPPMAEDPSIAVVEVARRFAEAGDAAARAALCLPVAAELASGQAEFLSEDSKVPRGWGKVVILPQCLSATRGSWQLTFEDRSFSRWTMLLVAGEEGMRIDAQATFGLGEVPWNQLAGAAGRGPIELLVVAEPDSYHNFAYANARRWRCLALTNPQDSQRWFGYYEIGGEVEGQLRRAAPGLIPGQAADGETSSRLRLVVEISPEDAPRQQLRILGVLGAGWSEEVEQASEREGAAAPPLAPGQPAGVAAGEDEEAPRASAPLDYLQLE